MSRCTAWAPYMLGLAVLLLPSRPSLAAADSFSCSLSLNGTSAYPAKLTFSDVSLDCVPVPPTSAAETLSMQVHPDLFTLYHESFTGVEATMASIDSLISIDSAANVTFDSCSLVNVQAWYLKHIIHVPPPTSASYEYGVQTTITSFATFDNLLCDSCNSSEALISHQDGSLTMLNSRFTGLMNTALYTTGTFLALSNSSFLGKQGAVPRNPRLVIDGANVTMTSCTFSDNLANIEGGAISAKSPSIIISHSHFSNNSGSKGGAVDIRAHLGDIANCTFENNHATVQDGGAVRFQGYEDVYEERLSNFTVTDSVFMGNEAYNSAGSICAFGTHVYWLDISGCTFDSNAANGSERGPWQGSAVGVDNPHAATNVFLRESVFTNSVAGASVFLRNTLCVGVINSVFANSSQVGLSILGTIGDDCEDYWGPRDKNLFQKNITTVATASEQDRIADFFLGAQLTNHILNCTFSNHKVYQPASIVDYNTGGGSAGGAALFIQGGLVSHNLIEGSRFEGNTGLHGSGVYMMSSSATVIWQSVFSGNVATGRGGALTSVLNADNGVMVGNTSFLQNTAFAGGALHGDANTQFILTSGTQFIGNNASTGGGAVFCDTCRALQLDAGTVIQQSHAGSNGGGIACDACALIQLNGVAFQNNTAGYSSDGHQMDRGNGGAVHIDGTGATLFNMTNCSAFGNNGTSDGGALSITGGAAIINNSSFTSNTAHYYGGAIAYIDECFSVAGKTSSTYFPWSTELPMLASLTSNCSALVLTGGAWSGNQANTSGAVLYSSNIDTTFIDCHGSSGQELSQSSAATSALQELSLPCQTTSWGFNGDGPDTCSDTGCSPELLHYFAFPPSTLNVSSEPLTEYVSNGIPLHPLTVQALDQAGQPVIPDGETPIQVLVNASIVSLSGGGQTNMTDPPLLQGQTQATLSMAGRADITGLILNGRPGLYTLAITLPSYAQVPPSNVSVTVRDCIFGEVRRTETQCVQCSSPQYSLDPANNTCESKCPENANCTGGALVTPLQGFWVSAPGSDSIRACSLTEACKGDRSVLQSDLAAYFASATTFSGQKERSILALSDLSSSESTATAEQFLRTQCTDGYYGPACSLCVRNSTHSFGRTGPVKCHVCPKPAPIVLAYIGSTLLVVLYVCYNIHTTLQENVEEVQGAVSLVKTSELLKALTLWLQYTSLLGRINVPAPDSLHWLFSITSFVFSSIASGTLSTDCLLSSGPTNLAFKRLIVQVAGPAITLVVIMAIQVCWWVFERRRSRMVAAASGSESAARMTVGREQLQCRMLVTLLTTMTFYFPTVFATTLAFFTCYRLDSAVFGAVYPNNAKAAWKYGYWYPDMTIPCWQSWHLRHAVSVGVPMLVLCILLPLLPLLLLFRQRKYLKSTYVRIRLGFIYQPFVPRLWFWETIELSQTFALASGIALAASTNSYYQLSVGLTVLLVGFGLLSLLRPYCRAISQAAQVFSLFTVLGTAVGCLYMLNADTTFVASQAGLNAVGVLIVLLNSAFVLLMAVLIMRSSTGKVKSMLLLLGDQIIRVSHKLKLCLGCGLRHRGATPNNSQSKLSVQLHSPGTSCNTSRTGSTQLLVSPIDGTSGDLDAKGIP